MLKGKKVCIVTWYGSNNYGTNLQVYALYSVVKKLGLSPDLIRPFEHRKQIHQYPGQKRRWISNMKARLKCWLYMETPELVRQQKIMQFLKKEFTFSDLIINDIQAKALSSQYDYFLTGSDQIWNPYTLDTFYLLDFVQDGKKKVSYSSSIAVNTIPDNQKEIYRQYLGDFKALSCRELTGSVVLQKLVGKEVRNVLDPVLLLPSQEWRTFSQKASLKENVNISEPFVFCYFIGDKKQDWEAVEEILREQNIQRCLIFTVFPCVSKVKGATYLRDADIADFIWFLDHAQFVCTDSFHSMAMCVKLCKSFVAFIRCKENERTENSRVYDFLDHYGLTHRIYQKGVLLPAISFEEVSRKLEYDIAQSLEYLEKNLI